MMVSFIRRVDVLIADALFLFCFVFDRLLRLSLYSEVGDLSAKFVTY